MIENDLLRHSKNQKYLIFDFETEGLNLVYSRPWQLAWSITEGRNIKKSFNKYIWWDDLNVSKEAAEATRFDYEDYRKKAEDPKGVLNLFDKYLLDKDYIVLGHNILGFDVFIYRVLRRYLGEKSNYSDFINRCIDTLAYSRAYKLGINPEPTVLWQYKMLDTYKKRMGTSLQAMCKEFDIDFDFRMLHDAYYDIEKNFEVFWELLYKLEIKKPAKKIDF